MEATTTTTTFVRAKSNGRTPHRYESAPKLSVTAAETGLLGIALGGNYTALVDVVGKYQLDEHVFSLPGLGAAFDAACDQRAAADGEPADVRLVWARLAEAAEAEGATQAYGITPVQLGGWAELAPPSVNADFYAWSVAEEAYGRAVRQGVTTATGRLGDGQNPASVARWVVEEMNRLDAAHSGIRATTGTGLTRSEEKDFWGSTWQLLHIRQAAWARMTPAWATLGCVLLRVIAAVPPEYVLPDIIGSEASLNVFLAVVGASGEGKGLAMGAARKYVDVGPIDSINIGTGEGLSRSFVDWVPDKDNPAGGELIQVRTSMMFNATEVDNLAAIMGRKGATIAGTLRQAWMGEELGAGNSAKELRLKVAEHTYRATLVVGVQPKKADPLLNESEAAGGTPQRFLWVPTTDLLIPRWKDRPTKPPGLEWKLPPWPEYAPFTPGLHVIPVCRAVEEAVGGARDARLRGIGDPLNGHAVLNREKWAAALGLLHGDVGISDLFWELSSVLMRVSDYTRGVVAEELGKATTAEDHKRAESYARQRVMAEDEMEAKYTQRTTKAVLARLEKMRAERGPEAWMAESDLLRSLRAKTQRPYLADVLPGLRSTGQVEGRPTESEGTPGMKYRLVGTR